MLGPQLSLSRTNQTIFFTLDTSEMKRLWCSLTVCGAASLCVKLKLWSTRAWLKYCELTDTGGHGATVIETDSCWIQAT